MSELSVDVARWREASEHYKAIGDKQRMVETALLLAGAMIADKMLDCCCDECCVHAAQIADDFRNRFFPSDGLT